MINQSILSAKVLCIMIALISAGFRPEPITATTAFGDEPEEEPDVLNNQLFRSVRLGNHAAAADLIARGADPNAVHGARDATPDLWASSVLIDAVRNGDAAMVRLLLDSGAEPDMNSPADGWRPVDFAVSGYAPESYDISVLLIDAGVDPNAPPPEPEYELHEWHRRRRERRVESHIRERLHDAATPGRDARRHDPRAAARKVQKLLETGTPLNNRDGAEQTPLIRLVAEGRYQGRESQLNVLEVLLARGAELDARDMDGRTALHHAVMNRDARITSRLLDAGAGTDLEDANGRTPADIAIELYPHCGVLEALGLEAPSAPDGGIRAHIVPSRTEGVAPLAVFFDATGTCGLHDDDFVNAHFEWDFDAGGVDPEHPRRRGVGFNAARVFRKSGDYTVRMRVKDTEGWDGEKDVVIRVRPFEGRTFYVAADGDDANPGTMEQPWQSFSKSLERAEPDTRILFRRGDVFPTDGVRLIGRDGPVHIGAYTDSQRPSVINPVIDGSGGIFMRRVDDWRFVGLQFRGQSAERSGPDAGHRQFDCHDVSNMLWWNLHIERLGRDAFVLRTPDAVIVADCYMYHLSTHGLVSTRGTRIGFIGNHLRNIEPYGAGYRTNSVRKAYVAYNEMGSDLGAIHSIQITGDTHQTVMAFNRFALPAGFSVGGRNSRGFVHSHLAEGNIMTSGFLIGGQHVTLRNNLFLSRPISWSGAALANFDGDMDLMGASERIRIHHNSVVSEFPVLMSPVHELSVHNNVFVQEKDFRPFYNVPNARGIVSDANLYYSGDKEALDDWLADRLAAGRDLNSRTGRPRFMSIDPYNVDFLKPAPGSPVADMGMPLGVWHDIAGRARPSGDAPDAGAYESE